MWTLIPWVAIKVWDLLKDNSEESDDEVTPAEFDRLKEAVEILAEQQQNQVVVLQRWLYVILLVCAALTVAVVWLAVRH